MLVLAIPPARAEAGEQTEAARMVPADAVLGLEVVRPKPLLDLLLSPKTLEAAAGLPAYQRAASAAKFQQRVAGVHYLEARLGVKWPDALRRQLSQSIGAFADDLRKSGRWNRVLLMTFSEFGRSVAENGRRGTDHGAAAPVFLVGGKLRGGLDGPHPDLADLDRGGVRHRLDFRRVYATVLDGWLGLPSRAILGDQYEPLDLLRA